MVITVQYCFEKSGDWCKNCSFLSWIETGSIRKKAICVPWNPRIVIATFWPLYLVKLFISASPKRPLGEIGFPLIWAVIRPTHGWLPFAPLIDIPKGFSSKMTLEVAARGLKVFSSYKLKTWGYSQNNAFCTKIMSIVINLYTVCKALFGISIPQGPK